MRKKWTSQQDAQRRKKIKFFSLRVISEKRFYFVFVIVDPMTEDLEAANTRAKDAKGHSCPTFLRITVHRGALREDKNSRRWPLLCNLWPEKKVEQRALFSDRDQRADIQRMDGWIFIRRRKSKNMLSDECSLLFCLVSIGWSIEFESHSDRIWHACIYQELGVEHNRLHYLPDLQFFIDQRAEASDERCRYLHHYLNHRFVGHLHPFGFWHWKFHFNEPYFRFEILGPDLKGGE